MSGIEPDWKNAITEAILSNIIQGRSRKQIIISGECALCSKKDITKNHFRNEKCIKEYANSGMCQNCQDENLGIHKDNDNDNDDKMENNNFISSIHLDVNLMMVFSNIILSKYDSDMYNIINSIHNNVEQDSDLSLTMTIIGIYQDLILYKGANRQKLSYALKSNKFISFIKTKNLYRRSYRFIKNYSNLKEGF